MFGVSLSYFGEMEIRGNKQRLPVNFSQEVNEESLDVKYKGG